MSGVGMRRRGTDATCNLYTSVKLAATEGCVYDEMIVSVGSDTNVFSRALGQPLLHCTPGGEQCAAIRSRNTDSAERQKRKPRVALQTLRMTQLLLSGRVTGPADPHIIIERGCPARR